MPERPRNHGFLWIAAVLILIAAGWWMMVRARPPAGPTLSQATAALRSNAPRQAAQIAAELLKQNPDAGDVLMVAAMADAELGRFEQALGLCERVAPSANAYPDAQCMAGNLHLSRYGDASAAEQAYRNALASADDHPAALERLSHLLSLQTRTWELIPVQLRLIRGGNAAESIILSLVHGDLLFPDAELIADLRRQQPDEAGWLLAASRRLLLERDYAAAEDLIRQAASADPTLIEAHARLGEVLDHLDDATRLQQWQASLPASAREHPRTWITLGRLAERNGDRRSAARCYLEAGHRDAASIPACYLLGKQLASLGRDDEAPLFLARARMLERYRKLFDHGVDAPLEFTPDLLDEGIQLAESLGLLWEACALARLAASQPEQPQSAAEAVTRLAPRLKGLPLQRTAPEADPFRQVDLSDYPLPGATPTSVAAAPAGEVAASVVSFEEVAGEVGIDFRFDNGVDPSISGAQRPYDFTGGGIAAFDYDCDGWPDLYCSQGCRLEDSSGRPVDGGSDVLYRNIVGERFVDTSDSSFPAAVDYSQGVSAGDLNNDGFADLFIANLGRNRLLINNGDGTFTDVSSAITGDAERWTSSCLICDLNADQWPDLYSVNYLSGDIIARVCRDASGRLNPCAPQVFPAAQDQLHLSDGQGGFRDATASSGIEHPDGKGLGIVAVDINADSKLDLFVANDGVPNFLMENQCGDGRVAFENVAMQRGVAVNRNGLSEACMGIVAEDLSLDGHIDLFVTNFLDETNTFYAGSDLVGYFDDQTLQSGLGPSSLKMLGFGVQALDGELDGLPDLIIANGHVDDFTDRDVPYRMPPQFYRNQGGARFELIGARAIGAYFDGSYLGRSVARLDWNRDGLEEVAIGDLTGPLALLRNATSEHGAFITLHLRATTSQRDAIGSVVTVTMTGGRVLQRQLISGDGYQASNQRVLVFGLGESSVDVDIRVTWPGGTQQSFTSVEARREYLLVEGADRVYEVPR